MIHSHPHDVTAILARLAQATPEYPPELLERRRRMFQHSIRLSQLASMFPLAYGEGLDALIEEAAELLTLEPDEVDIQPRPVSERQDERNSRPFPF